MNAKKRKNRLAVHLSRRELTMYYSICFFRRGLWDLLSAICDLAVCHCAVVVDPGVMSSSMASWARDWMRRQVFSRPAVVRVKLANWRRRFGLGFWMRVFTVIFFFLSLLFSSSLLFFSMSSSIGLWRYINVYVKYGVVWVISTGVDAKSYRR